MHAKNQGFSLLEVLMISALGSLLLLAATQVFATLVQQHSQQSLELRLQERAILAELALRRDLSRGYQVVAAGRASHSYPANGQTRIDLNSAGLNTQFDQFVSSDWLLINRQPAEETPDFSLWHTDRKTYGKGLAHRPSSSSAASGLAPSQTVIAQVELLRLRFYCEAASSWLHAGQLDNFDTLAGIQYALIIVSEAADPRARARTFNLWGEHLQTPSDGRTRLLVTGSVRLREQPL